MPHDIFKVLVNDLNQHCIWLDYKDIPNGWRSIGVSGTKEECLTYIHDNWKDIRPQQIIDTGSGENG